MVRLSKVRRIAQHFQGKNKKPAVIAVANKLFKQVFDKVRKGTLLTENIMKI